MKKSSILILGIIVLLIAGLIIFLISNNKQVSQTSSQPPTSTQQSTQKVKFSDSEYARNAYLISGDSLDSDAQNAISGFSISKTDLGNGSTRIDLKALESGYQDQSYVVAQGQNLYFIEGTPADDSPPSGERNIGDDHAILVDSDGYIVS